MKRHVPGLAQAGQCEEHLPDGEYLVEVIRIKYCWHQQKPFYSLQFQVLAPEHFRSHTVAGRLYCNVKALWKLSWFLTDFGYDPDLLNGDDIDEKAVVGLKGVLRLSQRSANGRLFPNLEAFASADHWNADDAGEDHSQHDSVDDREVA